MPDEGDIRDAVSEAWTRLESAPEAPAPAVAAPSAPSTPEPQPKAEPAQEGRVRDEQGRFTKSDGKPAAASNGTPPARASDAGAQGEAVKDAPGGPPAAVAAPVAPPASVSEPIVAPGGWKPAAREAFAKAPPEVQQEVLRRERELSTLTAKAQKESEVAETFRRIVAPHEHLFRAAGLSSTQAVGNVLQKYAALQTAPMHVRADIVAELFSSFIGTDEASINLLASALDKRGRGGSPGGAPAATLGPEQIQAMVQQSLQQERLSVQREQALTLVQQFEATQPEHLDSVRQDMADHLGIWERRNPGAPVTMDTFQQAYKKACLTNESVCAIEKQKEEAKAAMTANAATQKARASAVSVKSNPAGPSAPPPIGDDTRSHVAAAWERASQQ